MPTQTQSPSEAPRPLRFELEAEFSGNAMDMFDRTLFPAGPSGQCKHYSMFYPIENPYIDNEYRGFIRHLVLDVKLKAVTMMSYIHDGSRYISSFVSSAYPSMQTIVEVELDQIYHEYLSFLQASGVKTRHENSQHALGAQQEWKHYGTTSFAVSCFLKFYHYIYDQEFPDERPEREKDIWDVRKLDIPCHICVARPRYIINFQRITQPWLRQAAKDYQYYRIPRQTMATVLDDIKGLNRLSAFLTESYPDISSMAQLDRRVMQDFFAYLGMCDLGTNAWCRRIGSIRTFLTTGNELNLPGFPHRQLILDSDYPARTKAKLLVYSEREMAQLNSHLDALPKQMARILFVLENCGMRLSELLSTPILYEGQPSLTKSESGEYIFSYVRTFKHKINSIPVQQLVGLVLEDAISDSIANYGPDCIYIFAADAVSPISTECFSHDLNRMSKRFGLMRDDGSPLRVKSRAFRNTLATRYAASGIATDVIRLLLGQDKLDNMYQRKTIAAESVRQKATVSTPKKDATPLSKTSLQMLPNGLCKKPQESGICTHAYNCYACPDFVPLATCLPLYQSQLLEAEKNAAQASIAGYTRLAEINTTLYDNLNKIISLVSS